jgi:hypothetical protein
MDEQANFELLNRFDWSTPPRPDISFTWHLNYHFTIQRYAAQFSPPFYDLVIRLAGKKLWMYIHDSQNRGDFFCGFASTILDFRPKDNIINLILSALMMAFMFYHGFSRRTSTAKFAFWLIFVGLFNIAGLLTYLALNHTPIIKCPSCGKKRGLARTDCVRCNNELPAHKPGKLDLIYNT